MEAICARLRGTSGARMDAAGYRTTSGTVYVDPPYRAAAGYGSALDVLALARVLTVPTWVSEAVPLGEHWRHLPGVEINGIVPGHDAADHAHRRRGDQAADVGA